MCRFFSSRPRSSPQDHPYKHEASAEDDELQLPKKKGIADVHIIDHIEAECQK